MSHSVTITGVPRNPSEPAGLDAPRLNINDLVKDERMFALYVQAVREIQAMNENDVVSWFQVCGVHGLPYIPWDNAPSVGTTRGYCEHGTLLFPTWHRPYVALFEQLLNQHAVRIANSYTTADKHLYQGAAARLRAPYWDWASTVLPPDQVIDIVKYAQLNIVHPDGTKKNIPNPLLMYKFNPGFAPGTQLPSVAQNRPETVRCAKPGGKVTDLQSLKDSLLGTQGVWKSQTYDVLTRALTWSKMSNGSGSGGDAVNSLEAIHGSVHVTVGGDGHMSSVPVAGFDPIFWMHHGNVDRLLALWQAIHYDQFLTGPDATKNLLPFWKGANDFWNSNQSRTLPPLNYSYPEFAGLEHGNPEQVKAIISDKVNALYGPNSDEMRALASLTHADSGPGPVTPVPKMTDWTVRVRTKLFRFGTSYTVLVFIGQPPEDQHNWRTSRTFVGGFSAFVNGLPEHCQNCQDRAEEIVEGYVPLNRYFCYRFGEIKLRGLEERVVEPYLKEEIHWRIQKTDGEIVPAGEVEELEVAVMSVELEYSATEKRYKATTGPKYHEIITSGRGGGRSLVVQP